MAVDGRGKKPQKGYFRCILRVKINYLAANVCYLRHFIAMMPDWCRIGTGMMPDWCRIGAAMMPEIVLSGKYEKYHYYD